MKSLRIISAVIVAAISIIPAMAQGFTLHVKHGLSVKYDIADVDSVTFYQDNPPEEVVLPPKIGDFYYSDGTWSADLKTEVNPIGVVFYVGEATSFKDKSSFYRTKNGMLPFEEFHGYVVALKDATFFDGCDNEVWWSAFDSQYTGSGGSVNTDDFLGYTNTKSIISKAISTKSALLQTGMFNREQIQLTVDWTTCTFLHFAADRSGIDGELKRSVVTFGLNYGKETKIQIMLNGYNRLKIKQRI